MSGSEHSSGRFLNSILPVLSMVKRQHVFGILTATKRAPKQVLGPAAPRHDSFFVLLVLLDLARRNSATLHPVFVAPALRTRSVLLYYFILWKFNLRGPRKVLYQVSRTHFSKTVWWRYRYCVINQQFGGQGRCLYRRVWPGSMFVPVLRKKQKLYFWFTQYRYFPVQYFPRAP